MIMKRSNILLTNVFADQLEKEATTVFYFELTGQTIEDSMPTTNMQLVSLPRANLDKLDGYIYLKTMPSGKDHGLPLLVSPAVYDTLTAEDIIIHSGL